jgi:chromosome segregation ATPase
MDELKAARVELESQIIQARAAYAVMEDEIRRAEQELATLDLEILKAQAVADRDAHAVGTLVHHRTYANITGVVVESDGTGVSVKQDGFNNIVHGFTADEWVAL